MAAHENPSQNPRCRGKSARRASSAHHAAGDGDQQGLTDRRLRPAEIVELVGGSYASQLGIDLSSGDSAEIQKWFIAALLFGARISEKIAMNTYREFEHADLLSSGMILQAGWDRLVEILDRGGYVRYDFKTATKLLNVCEALDRQYGGDLNALHACAADTNELIRRVKGLGKGIGDVTANIFLRELRGVWAKANPIPSPRAIEAARALRLIPRPLTDPARIQQKLMDAWLADEMSPADYSAFEAALVRAAAILRRQ